MLRLALIAMLAAAPVQAGGLIAARTLPAGTVIAAEDLAAGEADRGITAPAEAIGMQTRLTIYEGRPILAAQLQPPRLVSRNQIVRLGFAAGALRIETEGRALDAGAAGETVRVLNMASRDVVSAQINPDGTLTVRP